MAYERFALGPSARSYFQEGLRNGLTIARLAAELDDLRSGQLFSFLPHGFDVTTISNYSYGGVASSVTSREELVRFLGEIGSKYPDGLIIFENRYARPADPFLRSCDSKIISLGEEVYHIADSSDSDDALSTALKESETAIQTAVMVFALEEDEKNSFLSNPSFKDVDLLLRKCIAIAVTAYDGEGYIIWSKNLWSGKNRQGEQIV